MNIAKFAMMKDFDLNVYDLDQLQFNTFNDVLDLPKDGVIYRHDVEIIQIIIPKPVDEQDKNGNFYKSKLAEGITLEYMPFGYEIHIFPDGFVRYTDGSTKFLHYPNSIKISKELENMGYPLL